MAENFTKFLINRCVLINFFVYFYIHIMAFEIDHEFELQFFKEHNVLKIQVFC